jgi:ribosomal protein L7/L12
MTSTRDPIDEDSALTDAARASIASGANWEETLVELRRRGASLILCIKIVRDVRGISLGEAKKFVHFSEAWADVRATHEALHANSEVAGHIADPFEE